MADIEKVIKGLECCTTKPEQNCEACPYYGEKDIGGWPCKSPQMKMDALEMIKWQDSEKKRIMKVIWDTLHEGLSIDTVADQDWVYEQIRHKIEDT